MRADLSTAVLRTSGRDDGGGGEVKSGEGEHLFAEVF